MAIVNKNLITKGLSGMLGGTLVFRRVGDKTVVSTAPTTTKSPTLAQQNQRDKFQQAVLYAKTQMADAALKAEYEAVAKGNGAPNAYNIAVADFFNAPDIVEVDLTNYTGKISDTIRVQVTDDFKVKSVSVEILNPDGSLVEKGNAVMQANKLDWVFTATIANSSLNGDKITIKALDMPGNETKEEQTL